MSTGLNLALQIGKSALMVNQQKMNVVGGNLANASTQGYRRQTATVVNNHPLDGRPGQVGTGAKVENIVRQYDTSLELNLRQSLGQEGYQNANAQQLGFLESIMAPAGSSALGSSVQEFAAAWQAVGAEPESLQARLALVGAGENVAIQYNSLHDNLARQSSSLWDGSGNGAIPGTVAEINRTAARIVELNRQVEQYESRLFNPQNANDLRDQRDALVGKLAGLADITVDNDNAMAVNISIGGDLLVDGIAGYNKLRTQTGGGGLPEIVWDGSGALVNQGTAGETQALLDAAAYIDNLNDALETFAATFNTNMNAAHAAGFDQNGDAGAALFSLAGGELSFLIDSPREFAAAAGAYTGDGTNARAIWTVMNTALPALNGSTLVNRLDHLVDAVAADNAAAVEMADSVSSAVMMFRNAVNEHSAVNSDVEMMSMLEIQRTYQATAKFVSAVNEMLANVLSVI